jgi:murein DD-endopeptidase MepM/ murein hydrolase activator NlpD
MKYFIIILLLTLNACTTSNKPHLTSNDKSIYISKLEKKINKRTGTNYGDIIIKYDLLNLHKNNKSCSVSPLYYTLVNNNFASKKEYHKKIRQLDRQIKDLGKEKSLIDLARINADLRVTQLKNIIDKIQIPSTVKVELAGYSGKLTKASDIFSVIDDGREQNKYKGDTLQELSSLNKFTSSIPMLSPMPGGKVTSNFGPRIDPFKKKKTLHNGLDLQSISGTNILAAGEGVVDFSGTREGYGKLVIIDHGHNFQTYYGHLEDLQVSKGDKVFFGQIIAKQGKTGRSTNEHLHYEVRYEQIPQDPKTYLNIDNNCNL